MPEGPSLVILKEAIQHFEGKKILLAAGNAKIDMERISGQKILELKTWGKQFFIILKTGVVRIHFLMFGSYSVDEQTRLNSRIRLHLHFKTGDIYFYSCAIRFIEEDLDELYDWEADVMSPLWNARKARKKLKAMPEMMVCDALLDQNVFSGVGNIIKNEVLYRIQLHPETLVGHVPPKKLTMLIKEAREYSFDFLKWKKAFVLKKHWLAHTKKTCKRCGNKIEKRYSGRTKRRTFFCVNCQNKY